MNLELLKQELKDPKIGSYLKFDPENMLGSYTGKKKGIEGMFQKFRGRSDSKMRKGNMIRVLKYKPNYDAPKKRRATASNLLQFKEQELEENQLLVSDKDQDLDGLSEESISLRGSLLLRNSVISSGGGRQSSNNLSSSLLIEGRDLDTSI